jgi:UDP-N-acetylglucosamine--N-acetylmuramyl-(pentapeptide) pyrophosphoryl-undecaprenol N-acetylglucosamine transferase
MKIAFTGGGSGGHFYPLIAVAEEILAVVEKHGLMEPELHYFADTPYDEMLLYQNEITFHYVSAGKRRLYGSFSNFFDIFKTAFGVLGALRALYKVYPDILFSKGGYVSVPVVFAAHLLRIPVVIHDSDAVPGRANLFAAKYARAIGVGYPEAVAKFVGFEEKTACVGNPVRKELRVAVSHEPHAFFNFIPTLPTVFVVGGSNGAEHINNTLLQAIGELLTFCQVIHQTGKANYEAYKELVDVALKGHAHPERYRLYPYMQPLDIIHAAGCATIIVSRAGSGSIFEIAGWGKPSILIPIPEDVSRDQRENAYAYARAGACEVVEQHNCTPHVLMAEIRRIIEDKKEQERMVAGAKKFARPDSAKIIAEQLVAFALKHEL